MKIESLTHADQEGNHTLIGDQRRLNSTRTAHAWKQQITQGERTIIDKACAAFYIMAGYEYNFTSPK